jgi:hypothetical protein
MINAAMHSAIVFAFCEIFSVMLFGASTPKAAPIDCPSEISRFTPADGDLFVDSVKNHLQRIRHGYDSANELKPLKPDKNISIYYFASPKSLNTPFVFALIRGYELKGHTSLDSSTVYVSNSFSDERPVTTNNYKYFHEEKRQGMNVLRTAFHMKFFDSSFSFDNSYDDVTSPKVYDLPEEGHFMGYKARMQRISGFPPDGRCVRFSLFEHDNFANAALSVSASLVELADKMESPNDEITFLIKFSAMH